MCIRIAVAAVALGCCPLLFAQDYEEELWDDPLKANNNWSYYDTDAAEPHDVDMVWLSTGGVGNSGYVKTPLSALDSAHDGEAFWPAYPYRDIGDNQEINLGIVRTKIVVYASDVSMMVPMDLHGGQLHFFIGQWDPGTSPGPEDDTWSYFYNTAPVTINDNDWAVKSVIDVIDGAWETLASNDPSVQPSDLFYHPQQWGFVIYPASDTPSGELAFDYFKIWHGPDIPTLSAWGLAVTALVLAAAATIVIRRASRLSELQA